MWSLLLAAALHAPYAVDRWNTDAGLPQNSVNAMLQSRDGSLWIATLGGLGRFDGTVFTSITTGDRTGLRSDRTHALAEDRGGRIWIGTEGGLSRYDRGAIVTLTTAEGLPDNFVRAVAAHPDGSVWFGTWSGALGRVDAAGVKVVVAAGATFHGPIVDVVVDIAGDVWVNTTSGIWRLAPGSTTPALVEARTGPGPTSTAVVADPRGGIWAATDAGIVRFGRDGPHRFTLPPSVPADAARVRGIAVEGGGVLWLGGRPQVWRVDVESGDAVAIDGFDVGATTSLIRDREGSVWIGNRVTGLSRIRPRLFQTFTTDDGLAHNNASAVFADSRGRVWLGARCDGAAVFENGRVRRVADGERPPCVWSFAEDRDGDIWMGGRGIGRWRDGRFESLGDERDIRAVFRDRDGTIWVGFPRGLGSWNGRGFDDHPNPFGVDSEIETIVQTRDGALWAGTHRGLVRYANGRFETFTTAQGLPHDDVRALYEDADGALWIGTYGGGLARRQDGRFTLAGTADGLYDNFLSSIVEDRSGHLWFSSNRGVFHIARRALDDFAAGRLSRLRCTVYGRADGMASAETNGGFEPAVTVTRDGRFWYPTLVGVVMIDPASAVSGVPPAIVLDRVLVNGIAHDASERLEIPPGPGAADVEIVYAGISLATPNAVTFQYHLDGWDRGWIDAGARRTAAYSHMIPGTYRFHVRAANRDGVWSGENSALTFTVLPHPWQTWWFRALVVVTIAAIPILRDRSQRRRQATLARLVDQQTHELREQAAALATQNVILAENVRLKDDVERISRHDLRTPLSSVISLAQVVRDTPGLPAQHDASLALIEQAGYRAMNLANLTLDLYKMEQGTYRLNARALDARAVAERVLAELQALMRTRGVTAAITVAGGDDHRVRARGDALLSHSMISNLVKNAVEASPAGASVAIAIVERGDRVRIRIHNRGAIPAELRARFFEKYVTAKTGGTGLGAYSARLMAQTQGGTIAVETSDEAGTTMTVELPCAAATDRSAEAMPGPLPPASGGSPGRSVLVVDDDENNRMILRHFLAQPNWVVDEAENGPLAVRQAADTDYDVILMDLEMPVMDGFETLVRMRALPGVRPTIVALSSHDDDPTRERALRAGFDLYLTKPVTRHAIVDVVGGSRGGHAGPPLQSAEGNTRPPIPRADGHAGAPISSAEGHTRPPISPADRHTGPLVQPTVVVGADLRELIPAFLERQIAEAARILEAIASDAAAASSGLHRIQGSLALYGFADAAAMCAEAADRLRAGDREAARDRVDRLAAYLRAVNVRYSAAST